MKNIVYAATQAQVQRLLATRDAQEFYTITGGVAQLRNTIEVLRDGKFFQFIGEFQSPSEIDLDTAIHIFRVLREAEQVEDGQGVVPTSQGTVLLRFTETKKEDFEQLLNLLTAVGFQNRNPTLGYLANEILYIKPKSIPTVFIKALLATPAVQKANTEAPTQQQKVQQQKQQIYGVYMSNPVLTIEPEIRASVPAIQKKANPFERIAQQEVSGVAKIDENALLSSEPVQQQKAAVVGCGIPTQATASVKGACKNCSCGRKNQQDDGKKDELLKQLESGDIKSSCGNCYLGDAFRCGSCPYKGLPAFKPGDRVVLNAGGVDTNRAVAASSTEGPVKIEGGRVKIQI